MSPQAGALRVALHTAMHLSQRSWYSLVSSRCTGATQVIEGRLDSYCPRRLEVIFLGKLDTWDRHYKLGGNYSRDNLEAQNKRSSSALINNLPEVAPHALRTSVLGFYFFRTQVEHKTNPSLWDLA